jgi:hypothetical protein
MTPAIHFRAVVRIYGDQVCWLSQSVHILFKSQSATLRLQVNCAVLAEPIFL